MAPSLEQVDTIELVDSMSVVEFDVSRGIFRTAYDTDRDPTSLAVVTAVAVAGTRDPLELSPLDSAIDPDALDALFSASSADVRGRGRVSFSFAYEGFEVTVSSDDTIELDPRGDA